MHQAASDCGRGAFEYGTLDALGGARSRAAFVARPGYAQFGIVQGGVDPALRARSAAALREIGFEGYAVGGLAVGEGQAAMFNTLDATVPHLPDGQPRYLMGVGTPDDIVGAVLRGIDMFDCVMPTRAGRTARAYTSRGTLNLRNARHQDDDFAARPGLPLHRLRPARPRLPAPSVPRQRNAGTDAAHPSTISPITRT